MNVFNKISSKISRRFSTLTTDASPSPRSVNIEELNECDSTDAPVITEEPDTPPVPPARRKPKKKNSHEEKTTPPEPTEKPFTPINTQATGNVINIINSNGFHWGSEIVYNFGMPITAKPDVTKDPDSAIKKTNGITAIMDSNDELTHEYMSTVSKQLGSGWRDFFRSLNYEEGMLDLMYESHQHKGVPEVIYQILLDWTHTGKRTLGELSKALWKEEKRTVVRDLAELYKSCSKENNSKQEFERTYNGEKASK